MVGLSEAATIGWPGGIIQYIIINYIARLVGLNNSIPFLLVLTYLQPKGHKWWPSGLCLIILSVARFRLGLGLEHTALRIPQNQGMKDPRRGIRRFCRSRGNVERVLERQNFTLRSQQSRPLEGSLSMVVWRR